MTRVLRVVADKRAAAEAAAARLVECAQSNGHIALAGGSTPRDAYAIAAADEEVDWSGATLWFSDERCVPPDHQDSNYGMVRDALLDRVPEERAPKVMRIRGEDGHDAASGSYEAEIRSAWGGRAPRFDLILLGLGPDSHTASLFPTKPEVNEMERYVAGVPESGLPPQVPRVTFTFALINLAREVLFLVAGRDKAQAVERCFGPLPDVSAPAARVDASRVVVVLDEAAASLLPAETRS